MSRIIKIKDYAQAQGFELVGIAPIRPVPDAAYYLRWLEKDYAGTMAYLHRGAERRQDPEKILPGVRSILCCGLNYYVDQPPNPISRYAWGQDYHDVIGGKLKRIEKFLRDEIDPAAHTKSYVDTGPVLERSYAAQAGLGWIGKNTMLINNGLGSYFFLGEILTTIEFPPEEYGRPVLDQCGTCTRCLDACPTQAFPEPGVLDARKCISYLTIEYRGDFSEEQSRQVQGHLYGCDICQEVCPYNDRIPETPLKEFRPANHLTRLLSSQEQALTEAEFKALTQESAMNRIKLPQWRRNSAGLF